MWEKRPKKLFGLAGITKGQGNAVSHRLRDTFAVELLLAGVPIERVSVLLGHQSVPVTEKHYNHWVRSRQEQLEADVARAWKLDPVLKTKNFGTNQVHFSEGVGELNENKGQNWRRGWESNPRIKVLQTSPLPLGYRASTFLV